MDIDTDTGNLPQPASAGDAHPNAIHLLRTMQAHHVSLSAMADQKANILIGVNSVIFALVVRDGAGLSPPMLILAASSALAAVLCMLAVVPAFGIRKSTAPPPPPNILFFGAFTRLTEDQFHDQLDAINSSDARIRHAMARDVYQLGQVLQFKKYRYLGWAYRVFIIGLVLTFAAFIAQQVIG